MIIPTFKKEKQLQKKGYKFIAGIDEVGRGPLAGPVVACAVVFKNFDSKKFEGTRDSKLLTLKRREKLYEIFSNSKDVNYGIGIVSEKIIDEINILKASLLAMKQAVENLKIKPDFLLLDGKWTLKDYPVSQTAILRGDQNIFSISTASIIAKVTRDKMLIDYDKKYPNYGFVKHKGYGTKFHFEMLKKYGPCAIHRKSFKPVKKLRN